MTDRPQTRYYLGFNLVRGIGPTRLAQLIDYCGSIAAAWSADRTALEAAGIDAKTSASLERIRHKVDLDTELERLQQAGIRLVTLDDADYPRVLREIAHAPPLLYVRGALTTADEWAVAVVGTRSPTTYGKEAARHIVGELARRGITIISGLAVGIDAIAHSAALEANGRTIGVLGCGVDTIYPERNHALAQQMVQQGALVSDYPLGTRPLAANFPPRNRIISGLSLGTLIVEAGERSGASITVEFALDQGRDVFAVPGSIFSQKSKGTHRLIRNGAGLVSCADDILEALDLRMAQVQQEVAAELPLDDPAEMALLAHLSAEPQHIDTIARACGMSAGEVSAILMMLALRGYVREASAGWWVRASGR
jgi:DNA processing protein